MRKILLAGAVVMLLAACSSGTKIKTVSLPAPVTVTVSATPTATTTPTLQIFGDLTLLGNNSISATGSVGETCTELGIGYADITAGTQVTVTSPSGTVLGVGALKPGIAVAPQSGAGRINCLFDFDTSGLPTGQAFYGVTVSHRGTVQFTQAQVEANQVDLSLGS